MPGPAPIPTLSMVHPALWRPRAPFGTQSPPPGCPWVAHLVHGPCLHRGWWRADTSSPPYKEPFKDFQVWQEETYYMLEPSHPPLELRKCPATGSSHFILPRAILRLRGLVVTASFLVKRKHVTPIPFILVRSERILLNELIHCCMPYFLVNF